MANEIEPLNAVYQELRRLAAQKMVAERGDHTLDATALVHEAWLRLHGEPTFASKSHFLRAASEAMRRILVDHARKRNAEKRGGDYVRAPLVDVAAEAADVDLEALDEALVELEGHDPVAAELIKLRYFAGASHGDAAEALGLTRRQADGRWRWRGLG